MATGTGSTGTGFMRGSLNFAPTPDKQKGVPLYAIPRPGLRASVPYSRTAGCGPAVNVRALRQTSAGPSIGQFFAGMTAGAVCLGRRSEERRVGNQRHGT